MGSKISIDRRRLVVGGAGALTLPLLGRMAGAQDSAWPSRQIRMICAYPAGGQTDLLARAFGDYLAKQLKQQVIVENRLGASGSIAAADVARAVPDGHTILCSISTSFIMNRVMIKTPNYDMDKDFTLVSVVPGAGLPLVAATKTGVTNLAEFVAYARNNKVNFGTYSAGSAPHMAINELNKQYGLKIEAVHYRGEAPMWTDLAGGSIEMAMGSYTSALLALETGRGKAFAVHSKRVSAIPDVKSLPEQGATSRFFTVSGFSGWAVSSKTPQPIVRRLAELLVAANKDPKVHEVLTSFVLDDAIGYEETQALYRREVPIWLETAQALGLQPS